MAAMQCITRNAFGVFNHEQLECNYNIKYVFTIDVALAVHFFPIKMKTMERETHMQVQHTAGPNMHGHKHTRIHGRYVLLNLNTCAIV